MDVTAHLKAQQEATEANVPTTNHKRNTSATISPFEGDPRPRPKKKLAQGEYSKFASENGDPTIKNDAEEDGTVALMGHLNDFFKHNKMPVNNVEVASRSITPVNQTHHVQATEATELDLVRKRLQNAQESLT